MKGIDKYGQMGRAALRPGLLYAVEILQGRADELLAEIAEIDGDNQGITRRVTKKKKEVPAVELERVDGHSNGLPEKIGDKWLVTPLADRLGYRQSSGGWGLVLQLRQHKIPIVKLPHPTIASLKVNAITEAGYKRLMKARGA